MQRAVNRTIGLSIAVESRLVVLPAFASTAAPLGARLAHRLSEAVLRRIFALFVALLGLRMWGLVR